MDALLSILVQFRSSRTLARPNVPLHPRRDCVEDAFANRLTKARSAAVVQSRKRRRVEPLVGRVARQRLLLALIITPYWILVPSSSQPSSVRCEPKSVVNNCRAGDITIINTIQPMKLALGS
jgi:hypothetical protein